MDFVVSQILEVEVFQHVYAVSDQQPLMDLKGPVGIFGRNHFDGSVIAADECHLLLAEPIGSCQGQTGFPFCKGLIVRHP